jgi:signal transduction histidine kinase
VRRDGTPLIRVLLATAVALTVVLGWGAYRITVQQRVLEQQRETAQLQSALDATASRIRERLAETGELLNGVLAAPSLPPRVPAGSVVLTFDNLRARIIAGALPFVPTTDGARVRTSAPFREPEAAEFETGQLSTAIRQYGALAQHSDPQIAAEALVRLGRALRKSGRADAALKAYGRLASFGSLRASGLPAEFVALLGMRAVADSRGDAQERTRVTMRLAEGLRQGRWAVSRGEAEFYFDDLGVLRDRTSWSIATAVEQVWTAEGRAGSRGQTAVALDDATVFVAWRSSTQGSAMIATLADDFFQRRDEQGILWRLADAQGHTIAGRKSMPGLVATRVLDLAENPWTLFVAQAPDAATAFSAWPVMVALATGLVFLWGSTYAISRSLRREAAVVRMQSDFVAAVSHEFRSPLTTIRQMAEMLETDRITTPERRHTYYGVLKSETMRLQRLVETLLQFGQMEAGAKQYQFQPFELATIIDDTAASLEPLAKQGGIRIDLLRPGAPVRVNGDASAITAAIRNLMENAIKYSAGAPRIAVEWQQLHEHVEIRVTDQGQGIPADEQQAIFGKFVRGREALTSKVRGTGVGLSMAQQIAAAHGGRIQLTSDVGRGSTFTLVLPIAS